MDLKYLLIILPAVILHAVPSLAIVCYECTINERSKLTQSLIGKNLIDECGNFNESLLVECPSFSEVCITYTITGVPDGEILEVNMCGNTAEQCQLDDGTSANGVTVGCRSCDVDGCNGAKNEPLKCYDCVMEDSSDFLYSVVTGKEISNTCGNFSDSALVTCPFDSEVCVSYVFTSEQEGERIDSFKCGTTSQECQELDGSVIINDITVNCQSCDSNKCNKADEQGA